jgi:hypothetical protein
MVDEANHFWFPLFRSQKKKKNAPIAPLSLCRTGVATTDLYQEDSRRRIGRLQDMTADIEGSPATEELRPEGARRNSRERRPWRPEGARREGQAAAMEDPREIDRSIQRRPWLEGARRERPTAAMVGSREIEIGCHGELDGRAA